MAYVWHMCGICVAHVPCPGMRCKTAAVRRKTLSGQLAGKFNVAGRLKPRLTCVPPAGANDLDKWLVSRFGPDAQIEARSQSLPSVACSGTLVAPVCSWASVVPKCFATGLCARHVPHMCHTCATHVPHICHTYATWVSPRERKKERLPPKVFLFKENVFFPCAPKCAKLQ